MKHLKLFLYFICMSFAFAACGGDDDNGSSGSGKSGDQPGGDTNPNVPSASNTNANIGDGQNSLVKPYVNNLEFPHLKTTGNNIVVVHIANGIGLNYAIEWDADKHSQRWSCYTMHNGNSNRNMYSRKPHENGGDFTEYPNDPFLDSKYHFTYDPYTSPFQHGHIFPSGDRGYNYNPEANIQTFYMTNMQPQIGEFNTGVWEKMERTVRNWNNSNFREVLYVCKGGTIDSEDNYGYVNASGQYIDRKYIGSGDNKIPVPRYFYMAVLCKKPQDQGGGYEAAAFWIEHKASSDDKLLKYLISIDELEQKTGIDFFCNLPDKTEELVEKTVGSSFRAGLK